MKDQEKVGLIVKVARGRLVISIGVGVLASAFETIEETVKVTDPLKFAKGVARELEREEEDGTNALQSLLDTTCMGVCESGGEGWEEVRPGQPVKK
jgi:hypothetical protein